MFDGIIHLSLVKTVVFGLIAHLGERLPCKQEVVGSIPTGSTNIESVV